MAYTITWTMTRPDAETALPTVASFSSANKSEHDTYEADNSVVKGYSTDGLVTTINFEFTDKAAYEALDFMSLTDEESVRSQYKAALIAANITCVVVDSDGVEIANF